MPLSNDVLEQMIKDTKEDVLELKRKVENIDKISVSLQLLNQTVSELSKTVEKNSIESANAIVKVTELIEQQAKDFSTYKEMNDKVLKDHEKTVEEIRNTDARKALEQKKFLTNELAKKGIGLLAILLGIGIVTYFGIQNAKLQNQLSNINNTNVERVNE